MTQPTTTRDIERYIEQSWVTGPGAYASLYDDLPADLDGICRAIRGLLIHYMGGETFSEERLAEIDSRRVETMLARILELDNRPLTEARSTEARLIGCCRDYATLLCSILRHRGVPARIRFGFATYFEPNWNPDHVVTEYWHEDESRWVLVDAELDEPLTFSPLDLPRDRFLVAGDAWQRCRHGELDPNRCGVNSEICGIAIVGRYVTHDLAALNRIEVLCWDEWGMTAVPPGGSFDEEELAVLDAVAAATLEDRTTEFDADPRLQPTGEIQCYSAAGFYTFRMS